MTRTFYFLANLMFQVVIVQVNAQKCVPQQVEDMVLHDNKKVFWNPSPTEICVISHYLIKVMDSTYFRESIFTSNQTALDVGYLPDCETIWVTISAISTENIEGIEKILYTKTAAPQEANLDLTFLKVTQNGPTGVWLEWGVADEWTNCAKQFRVVIYNEDYDDISTTYEPYFYSNVRNIIPCTSYVFTVTALYNLETEGHVTVMRYVAPRVKIASPSLQRMTVRRTAADLTWVLKDRKVNNCPVNALVVDGSPYFNISYPVSDRNQINRPPVNVQLTGLQPDTMYILRVSVNNTEGLSVPFIIAMQTLE